MSEKKIAVVTGGARGIGKAIALELAKAGNLVVINYNGSEEKARETILKGAGCSQWICLRNNPVFLIVSVFICGFLFFCHG